MAGAEVADKFSALNLMTRKCNKTDNTISRDKVPEFLMATPRGLQWRGFGGGIPTLSSVEFDKQLDRVSIWLEHWTHDQRCSILEALLHHSKLSQFQLLWTVIQPAMHRDFMYTAKKLFPAQQFTPISSHTSRALKERMAKVHTDNYHRINSAHLQRYDQLGELISEVELPSVSSSRLPSVKRSGEEVAGGRADGGRQVRRENTAERKVKKQREFLSRPGIQRAHTMGLTKNALSLPQISQGSISSRATNNDAGVQSAIFDGESVTSLPLLQTAPPCIRFIEMPMRRHYQDDTPRVDEEQCHSVQNDDGLLTSLVKANSKESLCSKSSQRRGVQETSLSHLPSEGLQLFVWYTELWDDLQKNEFLHKFLLKLDPRQHYFISSILAVKKSQDFLGLLPRNIALKILAYLTPYELVVTSRVNKTWYTLCNSNEVWTIKCQETHMEITVTSKQPNWKSIFRENLFTKHNWKHGHYGIVDCKGHTDKVLTVTFDSTRLATGSGDKTIKLWNLKTGKCLTTLRGHLRGVWCLRFFTPNLLISASFDSTIKVWNLRESSCTRTLMGHEGPVWSIVRRHNLLVSASQDKTAKVWDVSRCLLLHTLEGHHGAVFCVDMDEDGTLVVTGSTDRSVRLWDAQTGKQRKVIWASQENSIMSVSYSHSHLACCFGETILIYKIDLEGNSKSKGAASVPRLKLLKIYQEHEKRIESVVLRVKDSNKSRGVLVSAGKCGTIKYWNINRDKSIQTFRGHSQPVNCIQCDETKIVSASFDNKVKVWDFSVPPKANPY